MFGICPETKTQYGHSLHPSTVVEKDTSRRSDIGHGIRRHQAATPELGKKQGAKPETTDETKEMIRMITEAYATAMEDMQDEMNQAMNSVHLDILKRTAELKKVIDELQ